MMFGLFKRKDKQRFGDVAIEVNSKNKILDYSTWKECTLFEEIEEMSRNQQILTEYYNTKDSDIRIIRDLGFKTECHYKYSDLERLNSIISSGGILLSQTDIQIIYNKYAMSFCRVNDFSGKLTGKNIKDIVNVRKYLDVWSDDFKFYAKDTYNPPPNSDWYEIGISQYGAYPTIKKYKKEPVLHILHKPNSDKIIFTCVLKNEIYLPITYIKSERKNKIDDILE